MNTFSISYSYTPVVISVLLSMTSAYSAFGLADRMRAASTPLDRRLWLAGGSIAMGTGIWSMHYLGMLAVNLPISIRYDVPTVLVSMLLAMIASAVALLVVSADHAGWQRTILGGLLMGAGIGGMHYLGMAAMRSTAMQMYSPALVALSVVTAVVLSTIALHIAHLVRVAGDHEERTRIAAGALMGLGIAAMHYIAMTAVHFMPGNIAPSSLRTVHINTLGETAVTLTAVIVLLVAYLSAAIEKNRYLKLNRAHALLAESNSALNESQVRLKELTVVLSELSIRDSLTGLYNRRHFDAALAVEWSRSARSTQVFALLIVDIDHFKQCNDRYGHAYGDRCLQAIARSMENRPFRREDVIARIGGEEFAIILPGADLISAGQVADSIRSTIPTVPLEAHLASGPPITVSIGVSSCRPHRDGGPENMFREADLALYEAKAQGRNQVCLAHPGKYPPTLGSVSVVHDAHSTYCGSRPQPCVDGPIQPEPESPTLAGPSH